MQTKIQGHAIIVMAPTGSGKGTLINHVLDVFSDIYNTVSCTTRKMRPGEIDGKDYYFITPEEFENKVKTGEFLEWATYGLQRYGTLKSEIIPHLSAGEIVLLEIEVQGVQTLHTILPKSKMTVIYIDAGSWEVVKARALARAPIAEDEIEKRHERYLAEVEFKQHADIVIDNSSTDINLAKTQIVKLISDIKNNL
jgi:guanylate kinase